MDELEIWTFFLKVSKAIAHFFDARKKGLMLNYCSKKMKQSTLLQACHELSVGADAEMIKQIQEHISLLLIRCTKTNATNCLFANL